MSTHRRLGAAVLAASLVTSVVVALAASAPAGAAVPLAGTVPALIQGATVLGPAPAGPLSFDLVLAPSDPGGLAAAATGVSDPSSPDYEHFLTPAAYAAQFGPSAAELAAVETWAAGSGLSLGPVPANRTVLRLSGPSAAVSRALGVGLEQYRTPQGALETTTTGAAAVPAALAGDVTAVVGLSSLGQLQLAPLEAAPTLDYPDSYGPQGLWSFYGAPADETGAGQSVAVLAEGDVAGPEADLVTFEHHFGLPVVPWTTVPVDGASSDTSGDVEWDLDTQYATGMAPGVSHVDVYDGPSLSDTDVLREINQWVSDDAAPQANFSAGECEVLADLDGFQAGADQVLEEAAAQGQTLFTASGDNGAGCPLLVDVNGVPAGVPDVDYPASSPWAVGVGGTTILAGPSVTKEIGWYASGGGTSLDEAEPAFQASVGGTNLGLRRGVPDVAFDADPESGFQVVSGGSLEVVGGTSASSPSWEGVWARAQGAHGGALGFADPVIYREPAAAFNDIVVGTNGLFLCTPGYDYVTGRGTPAVTAFVADA